MSDKVSQLEEAKSKDVEAGKGLHSVKYWSLPGVCSKRPDQKKR